MTDSAEYVAVHELVRPVDGRGVVLVKPVRYAAFNDMQQGGFERPARLDAMIRHGLLYLADDEGGTRARPMTADDAEQMLGQDAAAVADLIGELLTPDEGDIEMEGDGIERPLIYRLRFPVRFADVEVTHLEFIARTYGEMRQVWTADDPFEAMLRVCAKPVHTGDEDMPLSGALLNEIDGYDLAAIAAYVVPVFTTGGGRSRILRRR